jgi:hypothetical protein
VDPKNRSNCRPVRCPWIEFSIGPLAFIALKRPVSRGILAKFHLCFPLKPAHECQHMTTKNSQHEHDNVQQVIRYSRSISELLRFRSPSSPLGSGREGASPVNRNSNDRATTTSGAMVALPFSLVVAGRGIMAVQLFGKFVLDFRVIPQRLEWSSNTGWAH